MHRLMGYCFYDEFGDHCQQDNRRLDAFASPVEFKFTTEPGNVNKILMNRRISAIKLTSEEKKKLT